MQPHGQFGESLIQDPVGTGKDPFAGRGLNEALGIAPPLAAAADWTARSSEDIS
jgi:hypothetical protein